MNNIPTVEEFLQKYYDDVKNHFVNYKYTEDEETYTEYAERNPLKKLPDVLIEFTQLHVDAALKAASENAKIEYKRSGYYESGYIPEIDKKTILESYTKENIK